MQAAPCHDEPGPLLDGDAPRWRGALLPHPPLYCQRTADSWSWPRRRYPPAWHQPWPLRVHCLLPNPAAAVRGNDDTLRKRALSMAKSPFAQLYSFFHTEAGARAAAAVCPPRRIMVAPSACNSDLTYLSVRFNRSSASFASRVNRALGAPPASTAINFRASGPMCSRTASARSARSCSGLGIGPASSSSNSSMRLRLLDGHVAFLRLPQRVHHGVAELFQLERCLFAYLEFVAVQLLDPTSDDCGFGDLIGRRVLAR